jgi:hypothetical protein
MAISTRPILLKKQEQEGWLYQPAQMLRICAAKEALRLLDEKYERDIEPYNRGVVPPLWRLDAYEEERRQRVQYMYSLISDLIRRLE